MAYKTITVPGAGKSERFNMTGLSVIVISSPSYQSPKDAPKISFDDPGENLPALNGSQWPSDSGPFSKVVVTGTTESAGDEIQLLSLNECIQAKLGTPPAKSIAGTTFTKGASDAVQQFSDLEIADASGNLPKRLYIAVLGGATRGINYAYNNDPAQGENAASPWDNDLSHTPTNQAPLEVVGIDWIQSFRFIATVAGETPTLFVTPEY